MTTTNSVADLDVWAWAQEKSPALETLIATKDAVLVDPSRRRELEKRLVDLGDEESHPKVAGLARWMLAQYHRAFPLLEKAGGKDPSVDFAIAECALKGQISVDGRHAMRRPDVTVARLEKHPSRAKNPRVEALYFDALLFDHDYERVKKAWTAASSEFKDSASGSYVEGRIAESDGDYRTARICYSRALERDPGHRATLLRLAYQLDLGGDDEEAMDYFRRLMALRPLDTHALLDYGVLLEDHGRYDEAIRCYRAILSAYPNHSRAQSYLRDARASIDMIFDEDSERRHDKRSQILRIPISDFELSVRARNCLAKMNIETLGDLVQKSETELLAYKNFGETSLNEIKELLEARGLRLGMNLREDPLPLQPVEVAEEGRPRQPVELPPGVDPSVLNRVLADLDLSVRCRKALAQLKAVTIGDLLQHTESELLTIKNFGQTSLNELKTRLAEFGVTLPE